MSVFRSDAARASVGFVQNDLVTRTEIARRLGVSRARVYQLGQHREFPPAAGHLGRALAWRVQDIEDWARRRGRRLLP